MPPKRLSPSEITERLRAIPTWRKQGEAITRDLQLDDFAGAVAYVQQVAKLADAAQHHPDILIHDYKHVRLTLTTHSAGGLTEHDFKLAGEIDALP